MTDPQCDQLDEYLCGWLSPHDAAAFEAHLADCTDCQEERSLQRQIDRWLADEGASSPPVPFTLRARIDCSVRAARRRRVLGWASAIAAASSIAFALTLWATDHLSLPPQDQRHLTHRPSIADNAPVPVLPLADSAPSPPTPVQVTAIDPASAILLPIESHRPNVTLVRVYPTIQVQPQGESLQSP